MTTSTPSRTAGISLGLIILLAALNALVAAAIDMYLPAFPAVAEALRIDANQVQQTLTVFLLGMALGQGFYGPLLDRFGRRKPLLIGIGLFCLGSLLAALTTSYELLLFGRFIQALGAAAGSVTPRAIIADTCDVTSAARAFSMLMQVMMLAPISAPIIGSAVLLFGSWQLIFWVLLFAGASAFVFSYRWLPETLPPQQRKTLSAPVLLKNYWQLLSHPRFLIYTLASGFTVGGLFTYISNSPFVFIEHFGITPTQYSFIFGASAAGMIVTGQINLRLLRKKRPLFVLFVGLFTLLACTAILTVLSLSGMASLWSYAVLLGLSMSTLGMISGNLTAITMGYVRELAGTASSVMGMLQFLMAGVLGFLVNLTPISISRLPLALLGFACMATCLCYIATHAPIPKRQA